MKMYFVQSRHPDGSGGLSVCGPDQIIQMFGYQDCTGSEFAVWDAQDFGHLVKLEYHPATHAPYNYHVFTSTETGKIVIEGYSHEH